MMTRERKKTKKVIDSVNRIFYGVCVPADFLSIPAASSAPKLLDGPVGHLLGEFCPERQ
jgi:hypothetical protein